MHVFLKNDLGFAPNSTHKIWILLEFRPQNLDPAQYSTPKKMANPQCVIWEVAPPGITFEGEEPLTEEIKTNCICCSSRKVNLAKIQKL